MNPKQSLSNLRNARPHAIALSVLALSAILAFGVGSALIPVGRWLAWAVVVAGLAAGLYLASFAASGSFAQRIKRLPFLLGKGILRFLRSVAMFLWLVLFRPLTVCFVRPFPAWWGRTLRIVGIVVGLLSLAAGIYLVSQGGQGASAGSTCISSGLQFGCLLLALGAFTASLCRTRARLAGLEETRSPGDPAPGGIIGKKSSLTTELRVWSVLCGFIGVMALAAVVVKAIEANNALPETEGIACSVALGIVAFSAFLAWKSIGDMFRRQASVDEAARRAASDSPSANSRWGLFLRIAGAVVAVVSVVVGAYVIAEGSKQWDSRLAAVSAGSSCIASGFQFGCLLLALGAFATSLCRTRAWLAGVASAAPAAGSAATDPGEKTGASPTKELRVWSVVCFVVAVLNLAAVVAQAVEANDALPEDEGIVCCIALAFVALAALAVWISFGILFRRQAAVDEAARRVAPGTAGCSKESVHLPGRYVELPIHAAVIVLLVLTTVSYRGFFRRMAEAERRMAEAESHRAALAWEGESKSISISDSVDIQLRSVPGPLWFGKNEVTQAQWEAVMGDNPSDVKDPDNPVECVSWDNCQMFLKILNALPAVKESGLTFRLPTEEEWERACRAGATGDYCLLADGTEITESTLGRVAWFSWNSNDTTHPVGRKQPNAFGLHDMIGNVAEWTSTGNDVSRVVCGGSLMEMSWDCVSHYRKWNSPADQFADLGFRLCASGGAAILADPATADRARAERREQEEHEAAERREQEEREAAERRAQEEREAAERKAREEREAEELFTKRELEIGKKRADAKKELDAILEIQDDVRNASGWQGTYLVSEYCKALGVRFDEDDPEGTGFRLGKRLKEEEKKFRTMLDEADRELERLEASMPPALAERLAAERRAREEREAAERRAKEEREAAERKAREEREAAERKAREEREAAWRERVRIEQEKAEKERAERTPKILSELIANMVQIPGKDFKMSKFEVTQLQWETIMGQNPSRFKGENNPVENVDGDCKLFLSLLNSFHVVKGSGLTFRLPTEEEWEYACRAGTTGDYCKLVDGTEITKDRLGRVAWFEDNSDHTTHPVGQKQPNAFGLYDMHGNVGEWTSTAWMDGSTRGYRGGSWGSSADGCKSSDHRGEKYYFQSEYIGVRLCAEAAAPKTVDGVSDTMSEPAGFSMIDTDAKVNAAIADALGLAADGAEKPARKAKAKKGEKAAKDAKGKKGKGENAPPEPKADWYVDAGKGNDSNGGASWGAAFASIQKAVDAASDGQTILVADGVYGPVVSRGKAVTIRSKNGPAACFVDGGGKESCADLANATAVGITFRNGARGRWVMGDGCAGVQNGSYEGCVITGNVGAGAGSAAGARAATLRNCLVYGNEFSGWGGAAVAWCTIANCTVANNKGNGIWDCASVDNCIVWGNSSDVYISSGQVQSAPRHSCYSSARYNGEGSIHADPSFADPAKGDFRLAAGSPCIDAGDSSRATETTDLEGNPRIVGVAVDIGCYERLP